MSLAITPLAISLEDKHLAVIQWPLLSEGLIVAPTLDLAVIRRWPLSRLYFVHIQDQGACLLYHS